MATEIDVEFVKDLALCAVNDGIIYERCGKQCIVNLQKKVKKGIFDENKAPKLFEYEFLRLAREHYELWNIRPIHTRMSKEEKQMFGKLVYEHFEEEIKGVVAQ